MRNTKTLAGITLLALAGIGCGPTWIVIKQANPNPLAGKKDFAVADWSWDGFKVGSRDADRKTLDEYVNTKKPEDQQKWRDDFAQDQVGANEKFKSQIASRGSAMGLNTAASGDAFTIKTQVRIYEPGFFSPVGFGTRDTEIHVTVQIADGAGAVVDEVHFMGRATPNIYIPTTGQRIRISAENIADQLGRYLQSRTAGK